MEKMRSRWNHGIFVGIRRRSNEIIVSTPDGIEFVNHVHRIPLESRWSEGCVNWVKWAPWHLYRGDENADGEVPEGVEPAEDNREVERREGPEIVIKTRDRIPRQFQIRKEDADKHGKTRGCPGCRSFYVGRAQQQHNLDCRKRSRDLLKDEARVKNAEVKIKEFEDRLLEKKRRKE